MLIEKFKSRTVYCYHSQSLEKLASENLPVDNNKCRYDLMIPSCFMCNATLNAYHAGKAVVDDSISVSDITDIMVFCSQSPDLHDEFSKEFERSKFLLITNIVNSY